MDLYGFPSISMDVMNFYDFNGLSVLWCITYQTLGTLVVLGGLSGVLPRPQMKSPSVPDDPKKRFEKFQKNRKSVIFTGF